MYSVAMPVAASQSTRKLSNALPTECRDRGLPCHEGSMDNLTTHNRVVNGTLVHDGLTSTRLNSAGDARTLELYGTSRSRSHSQMQLNPISSNISRTDSPGHPGIHSRDPQVVTRGHVPETAGQWYRIGPQTERFIVPHNRETSSRIYTPTVLDSNLVAPTAPSTLPHNWSVRKTTHYAPEAEVNQREVIHAQRIVSETRTSQPSSPSHQSIFANTDPLVAVRKYSHATLPRDLEKFRDHSRLDRPAQLCDRPPSPARIERKLTPDPTWFHSQKFTSDRPTDTVDYPSASSSRNAATATSVVPRGMRSTSDQKPSRVLNFPPPPPYSAIANEAEKGAGQPNIANYSCITDKNGTVLPEKPSEALVGLDAPHRGPHVGLMNHGNTCYMSVIFQCLRFTPSVYSLLTNGPGTNQNGKLFSSISELFRNMAKQATHRELYKNVENIRSNMGSNTSQYSGSDQQDATEFLTCLLDMLHSEVKSLRDTTVNSAHGKNTQSFGMNGTICSAQESTVQTANVHGSNGSNSNNNKDENCDNKDKTTARDKPEPFQREGREQSAKKSLSPTCQTGKFVAPPELARRFSSPWNKPLRGKKRSTFKRPCALICIDPASSEDKNVVETEPTHPAIRFWEDENKSEASSIRDTFMSLLQSYRKCPHCSAEKLCFSVVWNLGVPIPQGTNDPNSFAPSVESAVGSHTNVQTALEQGKRYGGSPSIRGQTSSGSKACILYDGSTTQNGVSPQNTWPKNKNCALYDDTNAPPNVVTTSALLTDCCASNTAVTTAYSLGTNRLQSPPMVSPPPPYNSGGSVTRGRRPVPAVSLNDCLDAFMLTEVLDGADRPMCASCGKKTACELHHSITRLPDILIIQLLRFRCGDLRQKIDVPVDFPHMINMDEYTHSEYEKRHKFASTKQNANDHVYWLYAVVYHDGAMSYGHYTAACRTTTGADPSLDQWYHFDDEFVKEMRSDEINKSSAYILFYERDSLYQQRKSAQTKPNNVIRCIDTRQPRLQSQNYETRV